MTGPTIAELNAARARFADATRAVVELTLAGSTGSGGHDNAALVAARAEEAAARANLAQLEEAARLANPQTAPQPSPQGVSVQGQKYGPSGVSFPIDENDPAIARWIDPVTAHMTSQGTAPPTFAMAWLAIESSGKPCAIGEPNAKGPDGEPLELGLWQAYNPDDLKPAGMTGGELRAYCEAAPGQGLSRAMTQAEIDRHMQLGVNLITRKRAYADHYLMLNNVRWPTNGPDYWAMVKAPHAWPPIVNTGLGEVCKHLGRAPTSWAEFRATYEQLEPRARFNPALKEQTPYYRGLQNSEWAGFHVVPPAVS